MKYLTLIFLLFPIIVYSQNVGIGTTSPDASAKLEIQSSNGGVLIPRLSTAERDLVSTPATGLLIFNASESRFEYYSGSAWMPVDASINIDQISDEDNDTKVEVERSPDEDKIYFTVGGNRILRFDTLFKNTPRITFFNDKGNIAIAGGNGIVTANANNISMGHDNHIMITSGTGNISLGRFSGRALTSGSFNVNLGSSAGSEMSGSRNTNLGGGTGVGINGNYNTNVGWSAGRIIEGDHNIAIGRDAGYNTKGEGNIILGRSAGYDSEGGSNTFIGSYSGFNNRGSKNVFLGYGAGQYELGSNRLYIANDSLSAPLIYGEFDSKQLQISESLTISNKSNTSSSLLINQAGIGKFVVHTNGGLSVGTDDQPPIDGILIARLSGSSSANIKADGDGVLYRDEATKFISFGPPALLDNPATGLVNSGTQFTKTIPDNTFVWAAINLPDGTKLKRWSVYFRGETDEIIRGTLFRKDINSSSPFSLVSFAEFGVGAPVKQWSFNGLSEVIDNENYTYFFRLTADSPSSEMYVEGVRFGYE